MNSANQAKPSGSRDLTEMELRTVAGGIGMASTVHYGNLAHVIAEVAKKYAP